MTLRLASVFRHVLAHSCRPLTSIREEIEFLRTYLYIEEARFGDRLQVEIDMAPEIAGASIPSLILQPLVENALKHGLGPKPGPGPLVDLGARRKRARVPASGGRWAGARRRQSAAGLAGCRPGERLRAPEHAVPRSRRRHARCARGRRQPGDSA